MEVSSSEPQTALLPQPFHANPSHLKVWIKNAVNIKNRMTGLRRCLWSEFEDINLYRLSNKRTMRLLWCLFLCTWDYHILDYTSPLFFDLKKWLCSFRVEAKPGVILLWAGDQRCMTGSLDLILRTLLSLPGVTGKNHKTSWRQELPCVSRGPSFLVPACRARLGGGGTWAWCRHHTMAQLLQV